MASATLFDFLQIDIETSTFYIQYFFLGVAWWCECEVVWRLTCFRSCIDVIVVRVKVSRGFESFFPMGIDSADISQLPNGQITVTS